MNLKGKSIIQDLVRESCLIYRLRSIFVSKLRHLGVNRKTDLVIEGFPRSANTYSVYYVKTALKVSGGPDLRISHHTHNVGQLSLAIKLDKPVIVLIRRPIDAILSFMKRNDKPFNYVADYYHHFNSYVLNNVDCFHIVDFSDVTENPKILLQIMSLSLGLIDMDETIEIQKEVELRILNREKIKFGQRTEKYALPVNRQSRPQKISSVPIGAESLLDELDQIYLRLYTERVKLLTPE